MQSLIVDRLDNLLDNNFDAAKNLLKSESWCDQSEATLFEGGNTTNMCIALCKTLYPYYNDVELRQLGKEDIFRCRFGPKSGQVPKQKLI